MKWFYLDMRLKTLRALALTAATLVMAIAPWAQTSAASGASASIAGLQKHLLGQQSWAFNQLRAANQHLLMLVLGFVRGLESKGVLFSDMRPWPERKFAADGRIVYWPSSAVTPKLSGISVEFEPKGGSYPIATSISPTFFWSPIKCTLSIDGAGFTVFHDTNGNSTFDCRAFADGEADKALLVFLKREVAASLKAG